MGDCGLVTGLCVKRVFRICFFQISSRHYFNFR